MHIDRHIAIWGLAGAAALSVALMVAPILFSDAPRWLLSLMFWGGLSFFVVSTTVVLVLALVGRHQTEARGRAMPITLMALGGILFFAGAIWLGIANQRAIDARTLAVTPAPRSDPQTGPDVALRFSSANALLIEILNNSDITAKQIKYSVVLWNLDTPAEKNPLPIPARTFDFVRPRLKSGLLRMVVDPVAGSLQRGTRLFGSASVECPDCQRGRTYLVYVVWGKSGWVSEIEDLTTGGIIIPRDAKNIASMDEWANEILGRIPNERRIYIEE